MGRRWISASLALGLLASTQAFAEPPPEAADEPYVASVVRQTDQGFTLVSQAMSPGSRSCENESGFLFDDDQTETEFRRLHSSPRPLRTEVTEAEAERLFAQLQSDPDLPFRFPEDGCFARAHRMAQLLELKGIESKKVFLIGNLQSKSSCADPNPKRGSVAGEVKFAFHVAPSITVLRADGSRVKVVLDPSMARAPQTFEAWKSKLTPERCSQATVASLRAHDQNDPPPRVCQFYEVSRFTYYPYLKDELKPGQKTLPENGRWQVADTADAADTLYGHKAIAERRRLSKPACIPGE